MLRRWWRNMGRDGGVETDGRNSCDYTIPSIVGTGDGQNWMDATLLRCIPLFYLTLPFCTSRTSKLRQKLRQKLGIYPAGKKKKREKKKI
jgi:hypothetical protein